VVIIQVIKNLDVQIFFGQASVQTNLYKATFLWDLFSPLLPTMSSSSNVPPKILSRFLVCCLNGCLSNNRNSNKKKVATLLALFISSNCNSTFSVLSVINKQTVRHVLKTLAIFSVYVWHMHYVFHESITFAIIRQFKSITCQHPSRIVNNWSVYWREVYLNTR